MSNSIKIESETVKKIKAMFPNPKSADFCDTDDPKAYCV